jgi:hypothetical protein
MSYALAISRRIRYFIVVSSVHVPTEDSDARRPAASSIEKPAAGSTRNKHINSLGVGLWLASTKSRYHSVITILNLLSKQGGAVNKESPQRK